MPSMEEWLVVEIKKVVYASYNVLHLDKPE